MILYTTNLFIINFRINYVPYHFGTLFFLERSYQIQTSFLLLNRLINFIIIFVVDTKKSSLTSQPKCIRANFYSMFRWNGREYKTGYLFCILICLLGNCC